MIDLDDQGAIDRLDSERLLDVAERFADQCRRGWELGHVASSVPSGRDVDSVVVLGMGGSGVSGNVVQAVVEPRLPVPFRTIKSYGPLPEWIGRNTLVFGVSYSGSTEETVSAFEEAKARGARLVAISSGGLLKEMAVEHSLGYVDVPRGLRPRAALGYMTLPILAVLGRAGLVPDPEDDVDEAVDAVEGLAERCHRKRPRGENPAKDLAGRLLGHVPVVYGGYPLGAVAAYRFKCDLNEYAKSPAFYNEIPELNHNEIAGWDRLGDLTSTRFVAVLLRDPSDHERVALRFEVTAELLRGRVADVLEVRGEGVSALARILTLISLSQFAAIYLGFAYGVDPAPIEPIDHLKDTLAER